MPFPTAFAFASPDVQVLRPPADIALYDMQNPRRPLTTSEVRNNSVDSYCCCMGGIVGELDVPRLTRCLEYIYALYPYLDSAFVWDEGLQWYRFDPRPHTPIDLAATMGYISDEADLARWFPYTHRALTSEHQTEWHLLKVVEGPLEGVTACPVPGGRAADPDAVRSSQEMAKQNGIPDGPGGLALKPDVSRISGASLSLRDFSYVLLFLVPHSLGDGSSFSAFYRRLNEFYVMPEEKFSALEREAADKRARGESVALQLSNYRHLCACPLDTKPPAPPQAGAASRPNPTLQLLSSCIKLHAEYDEEHPVPDEAVAYAQSLPAYAQPGETAGEPIRECETYAPANVILRFPKERYYRVPGCPTSHCLNAYSVALAFSWAALRGDIATRGEKGELVEHMTSVHDIRRAYDFVHEKGRLQGIDLSCDTMGLGTQIFIRTAKVSVDSTLKDIVDQLIEHEAKFSGQDDATRWMALTAADLAPISRVDYGILRATACISNLGVVNLLPRKEYWPSPDQPQQGPIRSFNGAAGGNFRVSPLGIGTYILCSSQEHGSFLSFGSNPLFFGPEHQTAFLNTWLAIQDTCRSEGAAAVKLSRCVELLRAALSEQGVERYK